MDTDQKVRENRLRRAAIRRGWIVEKSNRRDALAPDYGRFRMARRASDLAKLPYSLTVAEVERQLLRVAGPS